MAESNRLPWIDALKGFGIILVVLAHVRPWRPLEIYIYTFHMCMFFFISGFLFKDERNLKTFTKKKVKALLIPFILWSTLSALFGIAAGDDMRETLLAFLTVDGRVCWDKPIWFLLVLFEDCIIYALISRLSSTKLSAAVTSLASGLIAVLLYTRFRRCFPLYTHLVPVTLCYYSAGSLCRRLISDGGFIRLKRKGSFDWGIPLVAAAGIAGFILGSLLNGVRVSYPKYGLGDIRLCILSAICGTLFYFFLFKKTAWISGSRILARLGENSLFIMAAHYWLLRLAEMISMRFFGYSVWKNRNTLKALLVTFIAIVLIMLFRDVYVKLFGKNKTMMKIAGYFGMK